MSDNRMGDLSSPVKKRPCPASDLQLFDDVFSTLVNDITQNGLKEPETHEALEWFKKVCDYNVPFGKKNRGLTVLHSYKFMVKDATESDLHLARVLGWCVEWLQAFFLVADDIMDDSVTRRGQPCWFRKPGIGLIAINDSFFLESAIYVILKKYFRQKPYYVDIMELFHQTTLQTIIGQNLDLVTAPTDHVDFTYYTQERYNAIVKWKTAFYSFYLPVALAMYMAGICDEVSHQNAKTILLKMGEYFQIQDDYLDCYGDPEVTGKIGTDIEDNKCSWLIVKALDRCSDDQKTLLKENYGQKDPAKVSVVKQIFDDLHIKEAFGEYEDDSYTDLIDSIHKLSGQLPQEMFTAYADKIYKRQK